MQNNNTRQKTMNHVTEQDMNEVMRHLTRKPFEELRPLVGMTPVNPNDPTSEYRIEIDPALLKQDGWTVEEYKAEFRARSVFRFI